MITNVGSFTARSASGSAAIRDRLLDLLHDDLERPVGVDAMDRGPVERDPLTQGMTEPDVLLGLALVASRVAGQDDLERRGQMEDEVGRGDVAVEPILEPCQGAPDRAAVAERAGELRSVGVPGGG